MFPALYFDVITVICLSGYANVIQVKGIRIGGLSGIYKSKDYHKGHHELAPYTEDTKRSVYHIRNFEVFRLKQLTRPVDIFMSHDWPTDIARYGNMNELFQKKSFLRQEVLDGSLGSPPAAELLHKLQPSHWFSAHLHVKFAAHVQHSVSDILLSLSLSLFSRPPPPPLIWWESRLCNYLSLHEQYTPFLIFHKKN